MTGLVAVTTSVVLPYCSGMFVGKAAASTQCVLSVEVVYSAASVACVRACVLPLLLWLSACLVIVRAAVLDCTLGC
jgi:hypothetical protein